MFYENFDRFVVTVKKNGDSAEPVGFVFNRDGIFSWKLSALRLPQQEESRENEELLGLEMSDLHPDPENPGLLMLTTGLHNHATVAQNLPLLELTLNDANDKPVVRRALRPEEYLGKNINVKFEPFSILPIKLRIDASSLSVTGYRIYLFYASAEPERIANQLDPEAIKILPDVPK